MRRRSSILSLVASPIAPCLDHPAVSYLRQVLPRGVSQILEILLALFVRKVWGDSAPDSSETSLSLGNWSVSAHDYQQPLSLGDLDRLPTDVIVQILKLLGPKEVASSSLVCSSWRVLVSDNRLWIFFLKHGKEPFETVVFAETQLRSGPMVYSLYSHQVPFVNIFARRAMVPGSIVVDGGSGYCKYGWSKYAAPSGRCATFVEFGNLETPLHARFRHFFSTIYSRMQVRSSSHPIIVCLPICHTEDTEAAQMSRRQLREAIYSVLFDMNAPAVCAVDQAVLALYAARRTSGIVVNIGFNVTSVVPVFRGEVRYELGVEVLGFGASKITSFLKELMQQRNISFQSLYTVRTIKEKLCYVATDYNAELLKDTKGSCEVASEGLFTLAKERFQTGEILFQPHIARVNSRGLHEAVSQCIDHCFSSEVTCDDGWYKTVVLAGGTSCLPGLPERLDKELRKLLPPLVSKGIKVIPSPYGTDSAWFGAKILSNVSTFSEAWCITRDQFAQKSRCNRW